MSLELPRRLLADRLSVLLILGCGVALEAALWRHPGLPGGAGIVAAGLALGLAPAAYATGSAPGPCGGPDGWRLQLADGRRIDAGLGRGTRLLGPSVVLHWQAEGRSYRRVADRGRRAATAPAVRSPCGWARSQAHGRASCGP